MDEKHEIRNDIEYLINTWVRSKNENVTELADQIFNYVGKRFSLSEAQEIFFVGYFHPPIQELNRKEMNNEFNQQFLEIIKRGNY